jgi:hypothetical protein
MKEETQIPDILLALVARKHGWDEKTAREIILTTRELFETSAEDAINFLLGQIIPGTPVTICDGCMVRNPHEHRCHGARAFVRGRSTGKPCQCLDCFLIKAKPI